MDRSRPRWPARSTALLRAAGIEQRDRAAWRDACTLAPRRTPRATRRCESAKPHVTPSVPCRRAPAVAGLFRLAPAVAVRARLRKHPRRRSRTPSRQVSRRVRSSRQRSPVPHARSNTREPGRQPQLADRATAPAGVHPDRHHPVDQVVAWADRSEERPDDDGLVLAGGEAPVRSRLDPPFRPLPAAPAGNGSPASAVTVGQQRLERLDGAGVRHRGRRRRCRGSARARARRTDRPRERRASRSALVGVAGQGQAGRPIGQAELEQPERGAHDLHIPGERVARSPSTRAARCRFPRAPPPGASDAGTAGETASSSSVSVAVGRPARRRLARSPPPPPDPRRPPPACSPENPGDRGEAQPLRPAARGCGGFAPHARRRTRSTRPFARRAVAGAPATGSSARCRPTRLDVGCELLDPILHGRYFMAGTS